MQVRTLPPEQSDSSDHCWAWWRGREARRTVHPRVGYRCARWFESIEELLVWGRMYQGGEKPSHGFWASPILVGSTSEQGSLAQRAFGLIQEERTVA